MVLYATSPERKGPRDFSLDFCSMFGLVNGKSRLENRKDKAVRVPTILLAGLSVIFIASCSKKKSEQGLSSAQINWQDVVKVTIPAAPGIETDKLWQFQAVTDPTCLYMRFTYPDKLPPLGTKQTAGFETLPEGFNMLPFIHLVTPPQLLAPDRQKTRLPDGTDMDYQQVGDPRSVLSIHPQFFINSSGPNTSGRFTSGSTFDVNDIAPDYNWFKIGLGVYLTEKTEQRRTWRLTYDEYSKQADRFVIEEYSFIVSVPLAEKGSDVWAGKQVGPIFEPPLPRMSLRLHPSGTNRFVYYSPSTLSP